MSRELDEAVDRLARACANFGHQTNLWQSCPLGPEVTIELGPAVVEDDPASRRNLPGGSQLEGMPIAPAQPAAPDQPEKAEDEFPQPSASHRGPMGKVLAWVRAWFGAN